MGWGIGVPAYHYFSKVNYRDKYDVQEEIEFNKRIINSLTEDLIMYAVGHPKDFISEDYPTMQSLKDHVKESIESLIDTAIVNWKLDILADNFDCVDGDYVNNPKYEENIKKWLEDSGINYSIKYYKEKNNEYLEENKESSEETVGN